MSRAHLFLVVSADVDDFDVEDMDVRHGLAMVAAGAVEDQCMWPKGPVDVRVIDARLQEEADHA